MANTRQSPRLVRTGGCKLQKNPNVRTMEFYDPAVHDPKTGDSMASGIMELRRTGSPDDGTYLLRARFSNLDGPVTIVAPAYAQFGFVPISTRGDLKKQVDQLSKLIGSEKLDPVLTHADMDIVEPVMNFLAAIVEALDTAGSAHIGLAKEQ